MKIRPYRSLLTTLLAGICMLLALSGCKAHKSNPFPASGAVAGWEKTDETRTFSAQDLWQYIDGDSEQYIQAGVVSTSTSDYRFQGRIEAVVDVHTMRDAAGASKILENGHGADAQTVSLGDSGFAYAQSIVFRKGPYLVRIVAYQLTPDTPQALLALARGIETRL